MKRVAVNLRDDAINVFPDGSSRRKPRRGGIGFRIVTFDQFGAEVYEDEWLPGYEDGTNQQMELRACIEGVRAAFKHPRLPELKRIQVFTDSRYVVDNFPNAKFVWPKTRWCRTDGAPVANAELWQSLTKMVRDAPCRVELDWAKGHSKGNPHNKAADQLAKRSSEAPLNATRFPPPLRRKQSKLPTTPGSVRMEGQEIDVRIMDPKAFRKQRATRYRYEVLSTDSPYFGNVDFIFADSALDIRPGHHYRVRVSTGKRNPRIEEIVKELDRPPPTRK
jgi:ribonuclease HI